MDELLNAVKRHVAGMIGQIGTTRLGLVTSVNPQNHTAKVLIQPEGVMSGWLPVSAAMVGSGWGIVSLPSPGEQVIITPQEGDSEHGIITGRIFSDQQQPPKTYTDQKQQGTTSYTQPGEIALVHKSGKFIRLIGDRILVNGDLYVNGVVHATGSITSDADVFDKYGTLEALRQAYDLHQHGTSPLTDHPVPD